MAKGVAKLYVQHIFPHYGIPSKIISDRDPQFTGKFWTILCQTLGIQWNLSTTFHSQTDEQSKWTNQWTKQHLQIFGNTVQTNWANWLPIAQYVHNSWINKTIKQILFQVLIGITPQAHQLDHQSNNDRMTKIQEVRKSAQQALTNAQKLISKKQKEDYKLYSIRDQVWLEATNLKTTHPTIKLAPKRYGPFKITDKISNVVYKLDIPSKWKIHNKFHVGLLSPYVKTELHRKNFPEPPSDIINEEEYEVEQILRSKRTGKKKTLEYKVYWKGYAPAHDSWEPTSAIKAPELIKWYQMSIIKRKLRSSQINLTNMNYQSVSETPSKHHPWMPLWAYKNQLGNRSSMTNPITNKGFKFGKRTQGLPITSMNRENQNSTSSSKDKRGKIRRIKTTTPYLLVSINHYTMTTPFEHIFNNVVQVPQEVSIPNWEALFNIQQEMRRLTNNNKLKIDTPPELEENTDIKG